jgi:hypothetical protein
MSEAPTFEELIRRVRTWDQVAAAELVRRYEPAIRRAVRVRLANARLGNLLDSMDSDLQQEVRRRLAADERQPLELKNQGHDWAAIAAEVGGAAESLRKKLARAIDRVVDELGLDNEP